MREHWQMMHPAARIIFILALLAAFWAYLADVFDSQLYHYLAVAILTPTICLQLWRLKQRYDAGEL